MKTFIPQIRIISVDHDRTITAMQRLRKSMDNNQLQDYPIREVFCHLEAGRCGIPAGIVAIEVEVIRLVRVRAYKRVRFGKVERVRSHYRRY